MLINEIITHGSGSFIVYFRGDSWKFNNGLEILDLENNKIHREFKEKLEPYIQKMVDSKFEIEDDMSLLDILEQIEETTEIIAGTIENNTFELSPYMSLNFRHSVANKNLLKILDEYNLDRVRIIVDQFDEDGDEWEQIIEHSKEEFLEPLQSKTFYHGTSIDSLKEILNKGLVGNVDKTNFDKIHHEDTVFITLNYEKATFHAIHAAQNNKNTLPIIIEFEVPDVSKLVLDYDIAIELYGKEHPLTMNLDYDSVNELASGNVGIEIYNGIRHNVDRNYIDQITDKSSLNTKLGVFGYKGRIPSSKIKRIHVDTDGLLPWIQHEEFDMDMVDLGYDIMNFTQHADSLTPKEIKSHIEQAQQDLNDELNDDDEEDI